MNPVAPSLPQPTNIAQFEEINKTQSDAELQMLFESAQTFQLEKPLSPILAMGVFPDLQDLETWLSSSSKKEIFEKAIDGDFYANLLIILTLISHVEISDENTCIDLIVHYNYSVAEGLEVIKRNKVFHPLTELFLAEYDFLYGENKNQFEKTRERLSFLDSSYPHIFNIAFADWRCMLANSLDKQLRRKIIEELAVATKFDHTGSTLITLAVYCCSQDFLSKEIREAALSFVRRCANAGNIKAAQSIINLVLRNRKSCHDLNISHDEALNFCHRLMTIHHKNLNYRLFLNVAYCLFSIYILDEKFDEAYDLAKSFENDSHRMIFPYCLTFKELCAIKFLNTAMISEKCWKFIQKSYFHPIQIVQALENSFKRNFPTAISLMEKLVKAEPELLRFIEKAIHNPTLNEERLTLGPKVLERTKGGLSDILEKSSKEINKTTLVTLVDRFNFTDPKAKDYVNPVSFAKTLSIKLDEKSETFIKDFKDKLWVIINDKIIPYFKEAIPNGLSPDRAKRTSLYLKAILSKIATMNLMESNGNLKNLIIEMNGCSTQQASACEKIVYEAFDLPLESSSIEEVFQNELQKALIGIFNLLADDRPHSLDYLKKLIGHSTKLLSDKETLDYFLHSNFATLENKQSALDRFYNLWNADFILKTIYDYIQKLEGNQKNPDLHEPMRFLVKIYADATDRGLTKEDLLTPNGIEKDEYSFRKEGIKTYLLSLGFLSQVQTPISFADPYSIEDTSWIPRNPKIATNFLPQQQIFVIAALSPLNSTFEESSIVTLEVTITVPDTVINATLNLVQDMSLINLPRPYGLSPVGNTPQFRLVGENKVEIEFKLPSYELIMDFFRNHNFPLPDRAPKFQIDLVAGSSTVFTNVFEITKKVESTQTLRRSSRQANKRFRRNSHDGIQ